MPKYDKLSKMLGKTIGKDENYEEPVEESSPSLSDKLLAFYKDSIAPKMDESLENRQRIADDSTSILRDKIRMQMNPELQGPRQEAFNPLPAEKEYTEQMMGLANTVASAAPKLGSIAKLAQGQEAAKLAAVGAEDAAKLAASDSPYLAKNMLAQGRKNTEMDRLERLFGKKKR